MKSGIYSSKHIKTESKGQWWIPAILTLGFLLAFPVAELLKLGNWKELKYTADQMVLLYENLWKDGMAFTGAFVAITAALCNAVNGFRYLYSGKKTDFYHSLPIKRSRMFWQKVYVGILYYLIPYMVMEFLAVCIGAMRGFFSLKLLAMAVQLMGMHFLIYLLVYFCVVLVLCVTGNALAGILGCVFLGFYGGALRMLFLIYGETFFSTYCEPDAIRITDVFTKFASPEGMVMYMLQKYAAGDSWRICLLVLVAAVMLMILARTAYVKRPSEASGKTMVYKWIEVVIRFMVVIPFGLGIGWIFYSLTASGGRLIWLAFGLILGTVISHGLMETIYQMDFHGFFCKKCQLVLAGVLVLICAFYYQQDLGGYNRYCPKQEDLASINVGMNSFGVDFNGVAAENEDGTYNYTESFKWYSPVFALSDKTGSVGDETYKVIKKAIAEHKETVSGAYTGNAYSVDLKYNLKSGRSVRRTYAIRTEVVKELLTGLYNEENLKAKKYNFLDVPVKYMDTLEMSAADGVTHSVYNIDTSEQDKKAFTEAMKKDVEAATTEDFMELPVARLDVMYRLPEKENINHMVPDENYSSYTYGSWSVYVYPSFKNTLEILKKTGYPLSIDELDITGIKIHYYNMDDDGNETDSTTVDYTSSAEIKELKKAMVPGALGLFSVSDRDLLNNVTVEVVIKGNEESVIMDLLKDKIPDFVEEKFAELGIDEDAPTTFEGTDSMVTEDYTEDEDLYENSDSDEYTEETLEDDAVIGGADEPTTIELK